MTPNIPPNHIQLTQTVLCYPPIFDEALYSIADNDAFAAVCYGRSKRQ